MDTFELDLMNESADPSVDLSKKNYDENHVAIPQKKEISESVYNQAIDALIKTFKEGVEIAETLRGVTPVMESTEYEDSGYDLMNESVDEPGEIQCGKYTIKHNGRDFYIEDENGEQACEGTFSTADQAEKHIKNHLK